LTNRENDKMAWIVQIPVVSTKLLLFMNVDRSTLDVAIVRTMFHSFHGTVGQKEMKRPFTKTLEHVRLKKNSILFETREKTLVDGLERRHFVLPLGVLGGINVIPIRLLVIVLEHSKVLVVPNKTSIHGVSTCFEVGRQLMFATEQKKELSCCLSLFPRVRKDFAKRQKRFMARKNGEKPMEGSFFPVLVDDCRTGQFTNLFCCFG